jgi:crossover junction endodeoxyribonuclease RuvC
MRVLGIDPSLRSTGFGIVEEDSGRLVPVAYGVIKPTAKLPLHLKLAEIKTELEELIRTYGPAEAAIENPFYAQNMKTALLLGQVRGAVLVAVAATGCGLAEYSALEIKKAVTGYGQADKEQVLTMVRALLGLDDDRVPLDASDALAAAICHLNARLYQIKIDDKEPS